MTTSRFEVVPMMMDRAGSPNWFRWRGRSYRIDTIERIWRGLPNDARARRLYRIRAARRSFLFHHDAANNHWRLVQADWRTRLVDALVTSLTTLTGA